MHTIENQNISADLTTLEDTIYSPSNGHIRQRLRMATSLYQRFFFVENT